jgi:hypothetical protein
VESIGFSLGLPMAHLERKWPQILGEPIHLRNGIIRLGYRIAPCEVATAG